MLNYKFIELKEELGKTLEENFSSILASKPTMEKSIIYLFQKNLIAFDDNLLDTTTVLVLNPGLEKELRILLHKLIEAEHTREELLNFVENKIKGIIQGDSSDINKTYLFFYKFVHIILIRLR